MSGGLGGGAVACKGEVSILHNTNCNSGEEEGEGRAEKLRSLPSIVVGRTRLKGGLATLKEKGTKGGNMRIDALCEKARCAAASYRGSASCVQSLGSLRP